MLDLLRNRAYKRAILVRLSGNDPQAKVPPGGKTQLLFNMTMFALMGRVSKLDGVVTQEEIDFATSIMQQLNLDVSQRQQAAQYFDQGKQLNTDVMQCVRNLVRTIGPKSELADLFLKIQCRLAYSKGEMRLKEKILLRDVAEELGYDKYEFMEVCKKMQSHFDYLCSEPRGFLKHAYRVLQLEPGVEHGEIRRAYLRLMSRYHPDKLIRENLSEETLQQAQEKSQSVRDAYETLCGYRKVL